VILDAGRLVRGPRRARGLEDRPRRPAGA
jgi:hypothetical protein